MTELRRATVQVGDVETRFQWTGRGATVVFLLPFPRDWSSLAPLAAHARIVLPDAVSVAALPADAHTSAFARWLTGFLEGLGAFGVIVIAPARLGGELDQMRAACPGLMRDVVLAGDGPPDWPRLLAMIASSLAAPTAG